MQLGHPNHASIDSPAALRRAEERRADARLVTAAAECAARLDRVCADWSPTRRLEVAYEVAFGRLRSGMPAGAWDALRARYERHRLEFDARLVACAVRP